MAKTLKKFFLMRSSEVQSAASIIRKVAADSGEEIKTTRKEIFWMRDPKTGNWIPENRFGDVDVAELREKLLSKKSNS